MLKSFDATRLKEFEITEGKTSCLIPVMPGLLLDIVVRCENAVDLMGVTEDGQSILMETGRIVSWKGRVQGLAAVEIISDVNFWYAATLSDVNETVDPVPTVIEMTQTADDVLRSMIDQRLRAYMHAQELDRPLTDEEKDELILDIARGDLEFEERPDEFGLGYQERLEEFEQRVAEQSDPEGVPAPEPAPGPVPPAEGSTVLPT